MAMRFSDISIRYKIALAPVIAIACILLVSVMAWSDSRSLLSSIKQVSNDGLEHAVEAQTLTTRLTALQQKVYKSMVLEEVGERPELVAAIDTEILNEVKEIATALSALSVLKDQPEEKAVLADYATYAKAVADTLDIKSGGVATASSYIQTAETIYLKLAGALAGYARAEIKLAQGIAAESEQSGTESIRLMAGVTLVAVILCSAITVVASRGILVSLSQVVDQARALASGDLTHRTTASSKDEAGRVLESIGTVTKNLREIVVEVQRAATDIAGGAEEMAAASSELSRRTEGSAAALEQTAAAVEQLSKNVAGTADGSAMANRLTTEALEVANKGQAVVGEVVRAMEAVESQSRSISEIIATIDGIAFQTNILALNAAVEAARAGDQGRGFAVVANEVRALAQRSASAAKQVRTLIEKSTESAHNGVVLVDSAGKTMTEIAGSVSHASTVVEEIAAAAREQASGISQVSAALVELDRSTQQNASMVKSAESTLESLHAQSQGLVTAVSRFRLE